MKRRSAFAAIAAATCALATMMNGHDARACGGCFHPPPQPTQTVSDITDERMLLSVSPTQTTLYDQIRYSGTPSQFAWVLPIKGTVDVGLSADVLFDTVDALTTTTIQPPQQNCPPPPSCGTTAASFDSANAAGGSGGGVTVTKQQNIGPYETVQLHSTDPKALAAWLATNGFEIPADVTTIIDAYQSEGFDFLAMKLLPNEGITAMRPVRVTMPGASLSLPLRMAAIGTGPTVGITIWVLATGRYEPQNFPSFHIADSDLIWDWTSSSSNYATLRKADEALYLGRGWEIESSLELNTQLIRNAIESGGTVASGGGAGSFGSGNAGDDYLPVGDPGDGGASDAGDAGAAVYRTAEEVRNTDLDALLQAATSAPTVRVTRMRSDLAHAAMTADFVLQASADQAELSNVRVVTRSINKPACPSYSGCGIFACETTSRPIAGGAGLLATIFGMIGIVIARAWSHRRRR